MLTKQQFIDSCKHEAKVITHLAGKLSPKQWEYKPTPGQRSALELAQYLSQAALSATTYAITGNWDHSDAMEAQAEKLAPRDVGPAMQKQIASVESLIAKYSDADLQKTKTKTWAGVECSLGEGLLNMVLKVLVAYRMQLFLYAKASGSTQLGTMDCWAGVDGQASAAN